MLLILGDSRKIIFCERVHIPAILDVLDSCFSTVIGACHMLKKFKVSSKISYVAIILSSLAIAGCASRADSIAPTAIPSANYKGLECEETKVALEQKRAKKYALTNQQNNAATGDAVGVFNSKKGKVLHLLANRSNSTAQKRHQVYTELRITHHHIKEIPPVNK